MRLPVLLAHQDSRYPYELFSGSVAAALADGLKLDWPHLTIIPHIRGGPLFGLLARPLFALFGETTLALKLVPWLWHGLFSALVVAVLQRHQGRRQALAAAALLVAAPPLLSKLSVLALASHLEALLPAWLALAAWCPLMGAESSGTGDQRRAGPRLWLAFGLALGGAAAFHLQGLVLGLMMVGLLARARPGVLLRGAPLLVLGAAVGWSPALLFESDDLALGGSVLGGDSHVSVAQTQPARHGEVAILGRADKLVSLVTRGPGPWLEFGSPGEPGSLALASLCGWALVLAAGLGLWRSRRRLLALLRPSLPPAGLRPDLATLLGLHALVLLGLFVASGMSLNLWYVGTGLAGRRLVPALVSLLVLAALGLGARWTGPGRWLVRLLLTVLLATGAVGAWRASAPDEAGSLAHRGECYPWFMAQLHHHAGEDLLDALALVDRIDRGDGRFTHLRYSFRRIAPDESLERGLVRTLALAEAPGGGERAVLAGLAALGMTDGLEAANWLARFGGHRLLPPGSVRREAFLHGVGVGVSKAAPRPRTSNRPGQVEPWLVDLARGLPAEDGGLVMEGVGFRIGFVYDRYNHFHGQWVEGLAQLPDPARRSLFRGLGWGLRQRWVAPPDHVPAGLGALDRLEGEAAAGLAEGLLLERLPQTAARMLTGAPTAR